MLEKLLNMPISGPLASLKFVFPKCSIYCPKSKSGSRFCRKSRETPEESVKLKNFLSVTALLCGYSNCSEINLDHEYVVTFSGVPDFSDKYDYIHISFGSGQYFSILEKTNLKLA